MRRITVIPLTCLLVLAGAGPAAAHVTVVGPDATAGGSDATVTFRVPTESDTLSTTEVRIALPTDHPMASVQMLALAGWTETQKTVPLATPIHTDDGDITSAVSEVDWKAQAGTAIRPGSFGEFTIIAGQLPDTPTLTFKALQTYSDNSVVSWIQVPAAGQTADDVEYPAPVLTLGAAEPASASAGAAAPTGVSVTATPTSSTAANSTVLPTVLAIVAVVLAAVAVVIAAAGRLRRRRPVAADPAPQRISDDAAV